MATNSYFHHQNNEQDLVEDLTVEAIKIYGKDMVYLPRTLVNKDELFGEDVQIITTLGEMATRSPIVNSGL